MMARLQATGRMGTRLRLPATRGFASATTTGKNTAPDSPNVASDPNVATDELRATRGFASATTTGKNMAPDSPNVAANPNVATDAECSEYYNNASHYDVLWGKDNIHIGFYPHLVSKTALHLDFQQAAVALTERMAVLGDITHKSRVLDLGCGKGISCAQIAESTGAECVGVDLSPGNIERASAMALSRPDLRLSFAEGSFTALQEELCRGEFTHLIAQESFSHAHAALPTIFENVKAALAPGGLAVINDYLGADVAVSDTTQRNVHDRLGFGELLGHVAWRRCAESSGLEILHYENLNRHMAHGYSQLAEVAAQYDFCSADGTPLEEGYAFSAAAATNREIGLNLAVLSVL